MTDTNAMKSVLSCKKLRLKSPLILLYVNHFGRMSDTVCAHFPVQDIVKDRTYPSERHDIESVATTIDLIKEVAVGVMRCVVYLQLVAMIPADK